MKNQIAPIDVSIVSEYLGRFQTTIVMLLVFGITAHAWMTRDSSARREDNPLSVSVPKAGDAFREPLLRLIARYTGRDVDVTTDGLNPSSELYVMPAADFIEHRDRLGLEAVFAAGVTHNDRALVVAAPGIERPPSAGEAILAGPRSLNCGWVQLRALAEEGRHVPQTTDSLRWGDDTASIVYAVADGRAPFGALRRSDLDATLRGRANLRVVVDVAAVPEWIVASRGDDVGYFQEKLGQAGLLLEDPSSAERDRDLLELLAERGVGSLRPISPSQLERLADVCAFVSERAGGNP